MAALSLTGSQDIKALGQSLEIEGLSKLLVPFYNATGLANYIVDLNGNILHGVGLERKYLSSLAYWLLSIRMTP